MSAMRVTGFRSSPLLLLAAACLLPACKAQDSGAENEVNTAAAEEPAANLTAAVPQPKALDRAGLLEAVRLAASASATGTNDAEMQRRLDGRQFDIRVRFGCSGPAEELKSAALGWSFSEKDKTLRVRAAPTISGEQREIAALAPEGTEAIEGFWVPRPWILNAACPAAAAAPAAAPEEGKAGTQPKEKAPKPADREKAVADEEHPEEVRSAGPRVGIAEFFAPTDARSQRRGGRAYENTKVLEQGRAPTAQGFNLVLSGRLRALPNGKVVNCTGATPGGPPDCVVSATFDQVWIEWPEDRTIVAQWGRS